MDNFLGFVAYPSQPPHVGDVIRSAVSRLKTQHGIDYKGWEQNDIAGRALISPIHENIAGSKILVADVTKLNFNVTYEIGYAIGIGRRVFLVRNKELKGDESLANRVGIFDTLGYKEYENVEELVNLIAAIEDFNPLPIDSTQDIKAPVYILETPYKGETMVHILARVKKSRLHYRSFAPNEDARLSAVDAISHVARSFGVLIPLLSPQFRDVEIHNIRAAFVAGLAHGMARPTLILQDHQGPIPSDIKDFTEGYLGHGEITEHINNFSLEVFESFQSSDELVLPPGKFLSRISMGDPIAENELQTLGGYYIQTDAFTRALRGEVNLVVGRKGTGKTALFSQVRNKKRKIRQNVVVDLKPEGYQLVKLKEEVLDYLSVGAKDHLITSFWEYILYMEVCYKVLEKDKQTHARDSQIYEAYNQLRDIYKSSPNVVEGDFSERLSALSANICEKYSLKFGGTGDNRLTSDHVTELLHNNELKSLRIQLSDYLKNKEEVWILFDNLDKGWSSLELARGDVFILRCLIDAARKVQRQMQRDGHKFYAVIFIRNDVYQLLMNHSPDFGKETRASLDWSDADLLRELLRRRLVQNDLPPQTTFEQVWGKVCIRHYKSEESAQYLIDRCLMRPRNLLKLFASCRGFAVNLQHDLIEREDIEKGLKAYSNDLIVDADQELSDIDSSAKNLIYQFIGETAEYSDEEIDLLLDVQGIDVGNRERIVEFLLYYGFLGIRYCDGEPQYIYDVSYDIQILKTRIVKNRKAIRYVLNPGFWPGLGIH